jgi:two-component system phosphate regulon response regulator PhoB
MNLLIADDDRIFVTALGARLRKAGFAVAVAFDSLQAMMAVRRQVPDVILLDISMPCGGGIDVLRKVKGSANTNHVPVVVITATATEETRKSVQALGAETCFIKPVDMEELCNYLRQITGAPSDGSRTT